MLSALFLNKHTMEKDQKKTRKTGLKIKFFKKNLHSVEITKYDIDAANWKTTCNNV